jgi:hypothetical protein
LHPFGIFGLQPDALIDTEAGVPPTANVRDDDPDGKTGLEEKLRGGPVLRSLSFPEMPELFHSVMLSQ